jgi:hypothetical protein
MHRTNTSTKTAGLDRKIEAGEVDLPADSQGKPIRAEQGTSSRKIIGAG